jgi:hypothetical protein
MRKADDYTLETHFKSLAARLQLRACSERTSVAKAELQRLAECYARLAEQDGPHNFFRQS